MSKNKIIPPEVIDKLISEIDKIINKLVSEIEKENISEKDIETLNTDKLKSRYVKIHYVDMMSSYRQCLIYFSKLAKLDEDIDKLETDLVSKSDKLSAANQLNLLQTLLKRRRYLWKNVEEFKKNMPESLDDLNEFKLYSEEKAKELTMENMSPAVQELFRKVREKMKE